MNRPAATPHPLPESTSRRRYALLALAVVTLSTAALFIKASTLPPLTLSAMRLLLSAAALAPMAWLTLRGQSRGLSRADVLAAMPAALFLTLHFIAWVYGVRQTTAANATLMVNLNPVLMPFAAWIALRERINRREAIGSLVAVAGVAYLASGGLRLTTTTLHGDLLCALSIVFAVGYLMFARTRGRRIGIWLYIVLVYVQAGVACAVLAAGVESARWTVPSSREWLVLSGLVLVPTVIGHSLLQYSMTHLRSQTVSTANLGQFIAGAAFGWALFGEIPAARFYVAAVLVVIGALIVVRAATPAALPQRIPPETG